MSNIQLENVIFLDMDGVLCNPRACLAVGNTGGGFSYLDPIACMLVRKLCIECNARLVISSAWRIGADWVQFAALLGAACPNLDRYIWADKEQWRTPVNVWAEDNASTSDRGREILKWITANRERFNNFVILDDMADMRPLQEFLVRCDVYDGIGYHQYQDAKAILKAGYPE